MNHKKGAITNRVINFLLLTTIINLLIALLFKYITGEYEILLSDNFLCIGSIIVAIDEFNYGFNSN